MLPEPTLSFTLPSVHDNTTLDCRLYHPHSLAASPRAPKWLRHAAVVAHPYAPMGGCYDDPVVDVVAGTLLRAGFVVATFNFRGAGNSAGHTSWTSKAERADYMSLVGFVSYYVHHLDPFRALPTPDTTTHPPAPSSPSPIPPPPPTRDNEPHQQQQQQQPPLLLLAGYSYGAMITSQIPPLDAILDPFFATPDVGSAAAEIRLRAQHLAEQQNAILGSARAALVERHHAGSSTHGGLSPRKSLGLGLRIGGDEDRRRSHDSQRRSFSLDAEDKIRKGVADLMAKTKTHRRAVGHGSASGGGASPAAAASTAEVPASVDTDGGAASQHQVLGRLENMVRPRVAYLLVSPPLGWVSSLLTLKFLSPFGRKSSTKSLPSREATSPREDVKMSGHPYEQQLAEQKLVEHPCLAVCGDADKFLAVRRFREWTARLQAVPGSRFRAHEISTAGHFYVEEGVKLRLRDAVQAYAEGLVAEGG